MPRGKNRPSDVIGMSVKVMRIATGEERDDHEEAARSPAQTLGKRGGEARAKKLDPEQRKEIARKAAAKRWGHAEPTSGRQPLARQGTIKDHLAKLDELYQRTQIDWTLTIHSILTEPVCPVVVIVPEGLNATRYAVSCLSIEDGVAECVERVHREIILGEVIEPMAPFSNRDDIKLARWVEIWRRGEQVDWAAEAKNHERSRK